MRILISIDILDVVLDLIDMNFFSHPSGGTGRNVIIFGVDMSTKIDNRKKDFLILGKGPVQGLEHTLSAEKINSINFTENSKRFCLGLHYNEANRYLFVNGTEIYKFKAKDSENIATPLCLGNISKDFLVYNMKQTGLNGYGYDFSAEYNAIVVDDILDIHKYLKKKLRQYKMFEFVKQIFVSAMMPFSCTLSNVHPLKCVSMKNQERKVTPEIINVNSDEPTFHP